MPGADQHGRVSAEVREELLRQGHSGIGNGNRARTDLRVRPDFLGDRERVLKQSRQILADRARILGVAIRLFELSQDLGLAEHHGVEAAGDPEDMANRGVVIEFEQGVGVMTGPGCVRRATSPAGAYEPASSAMT